MYQQVRTTELEVGDIFTNEVKVVNREAFEVTDVKSNHVVVKSRKFHNDFKKIFFSSNQKHIFLRRVEE